jgi:hypothetical protein
MLPTKFQFIWPSGFRGEDFKKSAMFVNESGQNEQSLLKPTNVIFYELYLELGFAARNRGHFKIL